MTETISDVGMKPGATLIEYMIVKTPTPVQGFTDDGEMYVIKRRRYADETPLAIETHYYPVDIGMKLS